MTNKQDMKRARSQAAAQIRSVREMVARLNRADKARMESDGNEAEREYEEAVQAITEDALSLEYRDGWYVPGQREDADSPDEFRILLCTGGPAVRLIGDVGEHGEPDSVRCEYQDWFTPWKDYPLTDAQREDVLTYCRQFVIS